MHTPRCFLLLFAAVRCGRADDGDGTAALLRGAAVFEGVMAGLGSRISPHELPRAIGPAHRELCGLPLGTAYRHLEAGLASYSRTVEMHRDGHEWSHALSSSIEHLGSALRAFATACFRCHLLAGSKLARLAAATLAVNSSEGVRGSQLDAQQERPPLRVLINGLDASGALASSAYALRSGHFQQSGLALARAISEGETEEDDEPRDRDEWATTDAMGRVRGEAELHEHWRERRSAQREKLRQAEHAFETAPPTPLDASQLETAGAMCCCCWARDGERQELEGHTAHVW